MEGTQFNMSSRMVLVCTSTIVNSNGIWTGDNPLNSSVPLLTVQIVLVVLTTQIIYFILKPFKQPRFVAEILGGIVLGPSVLGRSETFTSIVFPLRGKMVLETVATVGLMYCVFLIGVKTDPMVIKRSGKKEVWIGLVGVSVSLAITLGLEFYLSDYLSKPLKDLSIQLFLGAVLSITSFAVLVPLLSDIHLLNSELGLLSATSAILSDMFGWFLMVVFISLHAATKTPINGIWAFLSMGALLTIIFYVIRPMTIWVVNHTPEGKPVENIYIFFILLAVSVIGFVSEVIGANSFNGALALGLAIPDGPPLGAALVEKMDSIVGGLLLPLFYALSGLRTNVFAIKDLTAWGLFQLIVVAGSVAKIVGTLIPALYFQMPFRDAITLSLMMCVKGLVEVITYNLWVSLHILDQQTFTILILSTLIVMAILSPFLTLFYEPSKRYVVHKRRTIQHNKPDTELRILACIHHQANVPTLVNILEASHATQRSPLFIIALHLVQLVGRSATLMIDHKAISRVNSSSRPGIDSEHIVNAFHMFEQQHEGVVSVRPITTVVPYSTMHIDVCTLALQERVSFIIIPFHKYMLIDGQISLNNSIRTMNQNVLACAPCSVGVLVDRVNGTAMCTLVGRFSYNLATLFFGGDDDREALAYTGRMAMHPGVTVTVMRFIPTVSISDYSRERRLDIESLDDFKLKNMNNDRVFYRESMVNDMEEIVAIISNMVSSNFDLLVVGMTHDSNPLLVGGISEWSEFPELGFVGDVLASSDFASSVSVLVIRQQPHARNNAWNVTDQNSTPYEKVLPELPELVPSPHRMSGTQPNVRLRSPLS